MRGLTRLVSLLLVACSRAEQVPVVRETSRLPVSATELVVFVVGSGSCAACASDSLRALGARLRESLAPGCASLGARTTIVGVAADGDHTSAGRFLAHAGDFDEIAVGRGWNNTMLQHVLRNDARPFGLSVPTVVLMVRHTAETRYDVLSRFDSARLVLQGAPAVLRLLKSKALQDSAHALLSRRP